MDVQQLDAALRVAGATVLLLLAVMLVRDGGGRRLAASFAPLAVCLSGFLIGNTPDPSLRVHGLMAAAAHLASGYAVVFLWWFCLASFDQTFRPRGAVLTAGLAWLVIASADRGVFGPWLADKGLSWVLVAIGFGMIAHLAWRLIRDRDGDLLEGRRQARVLVVVLLAGQLFVELSKEVVFGPDWRPGAYTIAQNGAFLIFALWLLMLLLRVDTMPLAARGGAVVQPLEAGPTLVAGEDLDGEATLMERLRTLVDVERAHLDPEMTFDIFVQRMGAPERVVRRLINHRLGHDHFRSFLNACRMVEARRLLDDPSRAGDKLIAISMDSGFASLASFNRVFRATEGCAPSAYRAACRHPAFEERSAGF
jgi:AraC-like DNA-binding protein